MLSKKLFYAANIEKIVVTYVKYGTPYVRPSCGQKTFFYRTI